MQHPYSGALYHMLQLTPHQQIVNELIAAVKEGKDVNLSGIKSKIGKKYGLKTQPKLVDIIAAIPEQHKAALLPKLRAKPVRTASGVRCNICCAIRLYAFDTLKLSDSSRRSHVQTSPMPSHCYDGKHLRVGACLIN